MAALLSIDGGGTRGAAPARMLRWLERRLGRPVVGEFSVLAGSSIGAVLACALASGMSAADAEDWILERGHQVFPQGPLASLRRAFRLLRRPRYSPRGLERALAEAFDPELRLGDLRAATLVTAVTTRGYDLRLFRSWDPLDGDLRVVDVLRATTAAPTYFPAKRIDGAWHVDGGVAANHPGPEAIAEEWGAHGTRLEEIRLLALGTGAPPVLEGNGWGHRGAVEWAPDLVETFMAAQSARADRLCRAQLGVRYHRAQFALPAALAGLDEPDLAREVADRAEAALQGPAGLALKAFA